MKRWISLLLCLVMALSAAAGLAEEGVSKAESEAERWVSDFLAAQKAKQKDPWVLAILEGGAREIEMTEESVRFRLRSFNPNLAAIGSYAKAPDKDAWRKAAMENVTAYGLEVTVARQADGTASAKSAAAFLNTVKREAGAAKGAFGKKEFTEGLASLLFCQPTADKKPTAASLMTARDEFAAFIDAREDMFPCESPAEWAPLFYAQRNVQFTVKNGPHNLTLRWDGVAPENLLNAAYDAASAELSSVPAAQRAKEDSLSYLWRSSLAAAAVNAKKGRLQTQTAVFDIDELAAGKVPQGYSAYFGRYNAGEIFANLVEGYRQMPAEASQPLPKTGVISQVQKKGVSVIVKVPKDGRNTYVQLRDADTGVIQAEAFIAPGKNVTMKVAESFYTAQFATGSTWYGTEGVFGPLGNYTCTNEFSVSNRNKWKLTPETEQPGIELHAITAADFAPTEDKSVHLIGVLEAEVPLGDYPENNPVISGESSLTGLAASGEAYTPVVMVLDNAEDAYPHWGVSQADLILQIPNAGAGATKLLAVFGNQYPEQAGPVRSGRSSMLPVALSFDAAFAFAGPPAVHGGQVDVEQMLVEFGMTRSHRVYNLLSNSDYKERIKNIGSHNLSCHVAKIHEHLADIGEEFEERPFLFADEKRTEGRNANIIRVLHRGENPKGNSNSASRAVFRYVPEENAYTRTNSSGVYVDRETGETVTFANVLVLRVPMAYEKNYIYLHKHMVGSGSLEIFQSGKYARGAWVRDEIGSRLVLVDENGEELKLQRGKTFIVVTNEVTEVIFTE